MKKRTNSCDDEDLGIFQSVEEDELEAALFDHGALAGAEPEEFPEIIAEDSQEALGGFSAKEMAKRQRKSAYEAQKKRLKDFKKDRKAQQKAAAAAKKEKRDQEIWNALHSAKGGVIEKS